MTERHQNWKFKDSLHSTPTYRLSAVFRDSKTATRRSLSFGRIVYSYGMEEQQIVAFKNHFVGFTYKDFSAPIEWTDSIGFSFIKKYNDDFASIYKIGVSLRDIEKDYPLKKLWVTVGYGKETEVGISLSSRGDSLSSPIDLEFTDEFYFDAANSKFLQSGEEVSLNDLLATVEVAHLRPTQKMGGIYLRTKLWFWRKCLPGIITAIDWVLIKLLWLISGEKISDSIWRRLFGKWDERVAQGITSKSAEFEESRTIDFFGYKAKRWSVVFYCTVHLLVYTAIYFCNSSCDFIQSTVLDFGKHIAGNNLIAVSYVVVSFAATESLIPEFLKMLIKKITPKTMGAISSKRVKV